VKPVIWSAENSLTSFWTAFLTDGDFRPLITTLLPFLKKARAMAKPIPRVLPVITMIFIFTLFSQY
jgi:hypothetical protein